MSIYAVELIMYLKNLKRYFKNELLLIAILFFVYLIYVLFLFHNYTPMLEQYQVANLTKEILSGNFFLKRYNVGQCPELFCSFIFYFLPVKIFGATAKAILCAAFLIITSSALTAVLLVKNNIKRLRTKEFLMFICFVGLMYVLFIHIGLYGAFLPFVFLALFFMNRFILTKKHHYLIIATLLGTFLVFGKVISVTFYILPLIIYSIVKIFYNDRPLLFFKVLISSVISFLSGLLIYYLYIKFNGCSGLYSSIASKRYVDFYTGNELLKIVWIYSIKSLMIIQNNFFFSEPIISYKTIMYFYRSIITLIGIVLSIKIFAKTFFGKIRGDFVSYILSCGLIVFLIFMTSIQYDSFVLFEHCNVLIPFAFALIIMRYKNLSQFFNIYQYRTLIGIQLFIYFLYTCNEFITKVI